jgi:hypothetical protein
VAGVRRGDELHENGCALSTTFEPPLLETVKNFSFRGCIRRPMGDPPWPMAPPYAAPPLREEVARPRRTVKGKGEYPLPSTPNV